MKGRSGDLQDARVPDAVVVWSGLESPPKHLLRADLRRPFPDQTARRSILGPRRRRQREQSQSQAERESRIPSQGNPSYAFCGRWTIGRSLGKSAARETVKGPGTHGQSHDDTARKRRTPVVRIKNVKELYSIAGDLARGSFARRGGPCARLGDPRNRSPGPPALPSWDATSSAPASISTFLFWSATPRS